MQWLVLFAAGLVGGMINSVSSGGSFFTYPALLATGLPSIEAAATTLSALTPGNLAAIPEYRNEVRAHSDRYRRELPVVFVGATVGIVLLLATGSDVFEQLVPWLILLATALFAASPRLRDMARHSAPSVANGMVGTLIVFVLSVYLTYFGSGVGNMFLAVLLIRGFGEFFDANAAKNVVITVGVLMATVVYGIAGLVDWVALIPIFIGSTIGGAGFARAARHLPITALRGLVITLGLAVALYQFLD